MTRISMVLLVVLATFVAVGCGGQEESAGGSASDGESTSGGGVSGEGLVVYSGRNEELVGPIIERFEEESGINVEVRYGDTARVRTARRTSSSPRTRVLWGP